MNAHQRRQFQRMLREAGFTAKPSQQLDKVSIGTPVQRMQSTIWRRIFRLSNVLWAALLAVATLTGLWLFWPKIAIEPYASLNPHSPFAQQFYIENASVYSIYNVYPWCVPDVKATDRHIGMERISTSVKGEEAERLSPGVKTNVTCGPLYLEPNFSHPGDENISLVVWAKYRLPLQIAGCKSVAFSGKIAADKTFIWTYRAIRHTEDPCEENPSSSFIFHSEHN